jgi:hypothetical protein
VKFDGDIKFVLFIANFRAYLLSNNSYIQISSGKEISMNVKFLKTRLYGPTEANARFCKEIPDNREISYNFTVIV